MYKVKVVPGPQNSAFSGTTYILSVEDGEHVSDFYIDENTLAL